VADYIHFTMFTCNRTATDDTDVLDDATVDDAITVQCMHCSK